jgi:hypothetical protein
MRIDELCVHIELYVFKELGSRVSNSFSNLLISVFAI